MIPNAANPTPELPLRDIHLPDPVGVWPLAPGWWLLAVSILIGAGLIFLWWRKTRQRRKLFKSIHSRFQKIESDYRKNPDALQLANALSRLLRRIAISTASRKNSASLTGQAWLEYLDTGVSGNGFSAGAGRSLIEAPYNPGATVDSVELLRLCRQWIDGRKAVNRDQADVTV